MSYGSGGWKGSWHRTGKNRHRKCGNCLADRPRFPGSHQIHGIRLDERHCESRDSEQPSYPGSKDKTFKVQFNPSELTLNANSTPVNKIDSSTGQARTIAAEDPKLSLRVKLYFDDMNTADSFMAEKFSSGATAQTIGNIAEGVKSAMGKKHTVQPQVEALVAALRNPYTRTVSFRWADFSFIGHLHAVHARYTMFSVSGRPVRAEVELMIQHEMDNILLRQWYEDFNKAFGGVAGTMTKAQQKVGNILNLNL